MTIYERFLQRALKSPDANACVAPDGTRMSYRELASAASLLAQQIADLGVRPRRIAINSRKRTETLVGFLACLHLGVPYVPLDPGAPAARRAFILSDAQCDLILETDGGKVGSPQTEGPRTFGVDVTSMRKDSHQGCTPRAIQGHEEAFVLYTSGSTGSPKGVAITHDNVEAFVNWAAVAFPVSVDDRIAVHAPLHFDLPVFDLFVGLSAGAEVHLISEKITLFPQALANFLRERQVTHLYAVPTALSALVRKSDLKAGGLPTMRRILFAGEEFPANPLRELMKAVPVSSYANLYGPIETNVVTSYEVRALPEEGSRVPIGVPASHVVLALLTDEGDLSFEGAACGEILVKGPSVSPGYINRPDLTRTSCFDADGETYYRTGDLAERDLEGVFRLQGRKDGLVKTRGFRVELGEVEAALSTHPGVDAAAVLAVPHPELTNELHAVVTLRSSCSSEVFLAQGAAHCAKQLPHYMVPAHFHVVDSMPTTSSGKTAKRELLSTLPLTEMGALR
ncbi:AMP-binding protein [Arthrobacter sp. E44]|uniref:AMP-binding protein n=1 Tax=Arthrobacter sp. E44 TaxID=3341794 RepID=UPI0035A64AC8